MISSIGCWEFTLCHPDNGCAIVSPSPKRAREKEINSCGVWLKQDFLLLED